MPLTLPIRTERLLLRPFVDGDFDALQDLYGRPEVVRWLYWEPLTTEGIRELLDRIKPMTGFGDQADALRLAITLLDLDAAIGDVSIRRLSREHAQGEIGFTLLPAHWGHGYATEASLALMRYGFEDQGLHRIVGRAELRNDASARVLERLGMRREADLHENEWVKGEWQSELVYAVLDREWS
jgi:RimJ/RimL family protein N-acetyltransferase